MRSASLLQAGLTASLALGAAPTALALDFGLPGAGTGDFYGQLSPVWLSFDDGTQSIARLVDNNDSNSRAGLVLSWPVGTDTTIAFQAEAALGFFQSNLLTMDGLGDIPWLFWNASFIRKLEFKVEGEAGTFWAGQGNMASYEVAEFDYSGTVVAGYSDYQAIAGGFTFVPRGGGAPGPAIKDVFVNLEGSRRFRLRYDTPTLSGFVLSVAAGDNQLTDAPGSYADAALRYTVETDRLRLGGGVGYALTQMPGAADSRAVMGSVAVLDRLTGLNAALAAGRQIDGGSYLYAKLGWLADLLPVGRTALAAEYYGSDGIGFDGQGRSWGLIALQRFDALSTEVYLGYRHYALDGGATDYLGSQSFVIGSKWTF